MGQEPSNIGYALVTYINTLPEGHILREIAERTLVDYNKRELHYATVEANDSHRTRKVNPPFRKKRPPVKELHSTLITNLKYLRSRTKVTQGVFARQLGISREALANIEAGRGKLSVDFLLNLSDRFGYTIEFLLTELVKDHKN